MKQTILLLIALVWIHSPAYAQELTLLLRVQANFENGQMVLQEVDPNGPAAKLSNAQFPQASAEPGDIIVSIDGTPIRSHADFVNAMNNSLDGTVRLAIRNVQDGAVNEWSTVAIPRDRRPFAMMRDLTYRTMRSRATSLPDFKLRINDTTISSTISSTIRPMLPKDTAAFERFRGSMAGMFSIRQHEASSTIFAAEDFERCEAIYERAFDRLMQTNSEAERQQIVDAASGEVLKYLQGRLSNFAQQTGRKTYEEATMPATVRFRVLSEVNGATVEVVPAADVAYLLANANCSLDDIGSLAQRLNGELPWRPLSENADLYGRYYYRFRGGEATPPLDSITKGKHIVIRQNEVVDGAIIFRTRAGM